MSVGAICFTSSGSNGGCWVVLVFPRLFFGKMGFFFPYATYAKKKKFTRLTPKKNFRRKKKRDLRQKKKSLRELRQKKKSYATYAKKKIKKRLTLISTIELRFPRSDGSGAHRLPSFGHRAGFAKVGGFPRGLILGVFLAICHFSTPPPLFFKPPKLPTPPCMVSLQRPNYAKHIASVLPRAVNYAISGFTRSHFRSPQQGVWAT